MPNCIRRSVDIKPIEFEADLRRLESQLKQQIKPTLKRYLVLFLFCLNSANKAFQWIQIPASTKKVTYYYDVDNFIINATSVLFMLAFVFLSWPACYLIELIGLRKSVLIGSFGAAVGASIKCFSCTQDGIYLLFLGQVIVSLSEQFIFSVPSRLASVWFPDHQVSSAVAMAILGNQLGVALGFLIPQFVLEKAETKEEIGLGLYYIFLGTTLVSVAAFFADLLFFDEAPKFAPGTARLRQMAAEQEAKQGGSNNNNKKVARADGSLIMIAIMNGSADSDSDRNNNNNKQATGSLIKDELRSLSKQAASLLADKNVLLLSTSYGINVGLGYAIQTILNQMLEPIWPGDDILIGNTGFLIIIFGAIGSPIWGQTLDKLHRYLRINTFLTLATSLSLILLGYVISFTRFQWAIYLSALLFGFFQTGLIIAGLELAVELTYPAPELVTSSLMNVMPQIYGTAFVFAGSFIVDNYGALATNCFFLATLLVSLILLMNIRETLKRQQATTLDAQFGANAQKQLEAAS